MKCIIFTYCETGKLCYRKILQILVQRIFSAFEKALVCQNRSSRTKDIMKKANPSPFFPKILHFHGRKCSRIRKFSCFTVYVTIYYLNTICATSIHEFESLYTCGFGELMSEIFSIITWILVGVPIQNNRQFNFKSTDKYM